MMRKSGKLAVLCLFYCFFTVRGGFAQSPGIPAAGGPELPAASDSESAATPPMGWNSYNCYGSAVHEDEVKANTDYMAAHLKPFGWQYIVVDFLWAYDNPPGSLIGNPFQSRLEDGSYIPWLAMDQWGRLVPDVNKFPSAFGERTHEGAADTGSDSSVVGQGRNIGFKSLADYIHSHGLKFGIHVMRGIPRQAVWARSPVWGAKGVTADQIADTSSTCPWMNHMYGLDMSKPGAQAYLNSLLDLYAQWGVDFIKVDDISRPYRTAEIEGYRKAIRQCGRPIVLSLSPGETPLKDSSHVSRYGNMWRMADDFWDNWKEVLKMFEYARSWEAVGGPGHWPDCDMLQIGRISLRGPVGPERYSRLTEAEQTTHMTFWCIFRSPLMLGGNLPDNRPLEERLFSNDEVLEVNQHGEGPHQLYKDGVSMVWVSKAPKGIVSGGKDERKGGQAFYIALFNIGETDRNVSIDFSQVGLRGKVWVRDLWKKADAGVFTKKYTAMIAAHGAVLIKAATQAQ